MPRRGRSARRRPAHGPERPQVLGEIPRGFLHEGGEWCRSPTTQAPERKSGPTARRRTLWVRPPSRSAGSTAAWLGCCAPPFMEVGSQSGTFHPRGSRRRQPRPSSQRRTGRRVPRRRPPWERTLRKCASPGPGVPHQDRPLRPASAPSPRPVARHCQNPVIKGRPQGSPARRSMRKTKDPDQFALIRIFFQLRGQDLNL